MTDLTYALRTLARTPGFTAIALLTIALGIGANTAIFSIVNGVLLQPLPFRDEARVVRVFTSTDNEAKGNHSAGDFIDIQRSNRTLQAIAGVSTDFVAVAAATGEGQQLQAARVTVDFFDVLGTAAEQGRTFTRAQDAIAAEPFVVLGHAASRKIFGTDDTVAGRRVRIDGQSYTVAGVMPDGFSWPRGTEVWVLSTRPVPPMPVDVQGIDPLTDREVQYFEAIARLKPGVTVADAQADLHAVALGLQRQHPQSNGNRDVRAVPLRDDVVGDVRDALLLLQAAVGIVLVIACANVSSLLIARSTGRRRELAVRAALGAGRTRLLAQLLAESLTLGVVGGLLGLLLGSWLVVVLVRILPAGVPRAEAIALDRTVSLVTVLVSLAAGVLFGLLPAIQASRADASAALRLGGDRGGTARARGRAALVVAEVALTLVLLVAAGLLGNSFLKLRQVDPGFRSESVTLAPLNLPQSRFAKGEQQAAIYTQLLERLSQRQGIQAFGIGFPGPLRGSSASATFLIEGQAAASRGDRPFANLAAVSGGYLGAMGIPLLAGRTFTTADRENAPPAAIVSLALAKKYWPGENPLGKHLRFDANSKEPWFTVVGVVGDVRQLGLTKEAPPVLYLPYQQFPLPFTQLAVRSTLPLGTIASMLRRELAAIDRDLAFSDLRTLQSVVDRAMDQPRFRTVLVGLFALLALLLAAVGVYGLISYTVTQRTREIGIRVALGAHPRQVLGSVIREGLVLATAGIAVGLVGAVAATRLLSSFLFGVGATDPATFVAVSLVLVLVAIAASYIPSRRALRVDPLVALRAE